MKNLCILFRMVAISLLVFSCTENGKKPIFFNHYKPLGLTEKGAIFSINRIDCVNRPGGCYSYAYNFMNITHKGIMFYNDNKIFIEPDLGDERMVYFDFSMKIGDTLNITGAKMKYRIVLQDVFLDPFLKDRIFKFRLNFAVDLPSPDIVNIVSIDKGILGIYACFPHYVNSMMIDDVVEFAGYGCFDQLNSNLKNYH